MAADSWIVRSSSCSVGTEPVGWLTRPEMEAILGVPDRTTERGRREYALLLFLYNTGARVSEAIQLKVRDLQIGSGNGGHDLATLHGKGGRLRQCPYDHRCMTTLSAAMMIDRIDDILAEATA